MDDFQMKLKIQAIREKMAKLVEQKAKAESEKDPVLAHKSAASISQLQALLNEIDGPKA